MNPCALDVRPHGAAAAVRTPVAADGAARLDHLVVMAHSLEQASAWCEATLGVAPAPGGEHPAMGTHNRLLNISSDLFAGAYLELIAIHFAAPSSANHCRRPSKRWFDMDAAALQTRVREQGPQLIAWVARVPDISASATALAAHELDVGEVCEAHRTSPHGLLQWRITVRQDGRRLLHGTMPTLIEWGGGSPGGAAATPHPCDHLPASGVALQALCLSHPDAATLRRACVTTALPPRGITIGRGPIGMTAHLQTPRGPLRLHSYDASAEPEAG